MQIPRGDRNLTPGHAPVFAQIDANSLPGPCAGDLFGLTVSRGVNGVHYVDDGTNTLNLLAP